MDGGDAWLITESKGDAFVPAWSPDGTLLAYVGHENRPEGGLASNHRLYVVPMGADGHPGGGRRECMGGLDRTVGQPCAERYAERPGSRTRRSGRRTARRSITVTDAGRVHLYRFDPAGEADPRRVLGGDRVILNAQLSADGARLAYDVTDWPTPATCYTCALLPDGRTGEEQRLTHVNRPYFEAHTIGAVEELLFKAEDGTDLAGLDHAPARLPRPGSSIRAWSRSTAGRTCSMASPSSTSSRCWRRRAMSSST